MAAKNQKKRARMQKNESDDDLYGAEDSDNSSDEEGKYAPEPTKNKGSKAQMVDPSDDEEDSEADDDDDRADDSDLEDSDTAKDKMQKLADSDEEDDGIEIDDDESSSDAGDIK